MNLEDHMRMMHIVLGVVMASASVEKAGLPLRDAKIALRVAVFVLDELYDSKARSEGELEELAAKLKPHIMEFIKSEMGVSEK